MTMARRGYMTMARPGYMTMARRGYSVDRMVSECFRLAMTNK